MAELVIELKRGNAVEVPYPSRIDDQGNVIPSGVVLDWVPALKMAAMEVRGFDFMAREGSTYPRPIGSNPESMRWIQATGPAEDDTAIPAHWEGSIEGFIGAVNTPPTANGMVTIRVDTYEWINISLIPVMPMTFNFILGTPPEAGRIA